MEISDVRVKIISDSGDRLKAVCAVTFDGEFVVRDVKVVAGTSGLFVAMPSRKVSTHCNKCGFKNAIRSRFCNDCGAKLPPTEVTEDENGRSRFHRDIAHPITTPFREKLQAGVLKAYEEELAGGGAPDYEDESEDEERTSVQATHEDRPDDEEESEVSEYDAIIAGLRSSTGRGDKRQGSSESRPRERSGSTPRREDRGSGGSGGGGGRRERTGERPPRSSERPERSSRGPRDGEAPKRDERRPRSDAPERKRTEAVEARPVVQVDPEPVEDFGAGIVNEQTVPARPIAEPKKQPPPKMVEPATVSPEEEEDGAFGEGIL